MDDDATWRLSQNLTPKELIDRFWAIRQQQLALLGIRVPQELSVISIVFYFFAERHIVTGLTAGAVKG